MRFFLKKSMTEAVGNNGSMSKEFNIQAGNSTKAARIQGMTSSKTNKVYIKENKMWKNNNGRIQMDSISYSIPKANISKLLKAKMEMMAKNKKPKLTKPKTESKKTKLTKPKTESKKPKLTKPKTESKKPKPMIAKPKTESKKPKPMIAKPKTESKKPKSTKPKSTKPKSTKPKSKKPKSTKKPM